MPDYRIAQPTDHCKPPSDLTTAISGAEAAKWVERPLSGTAKHVAKQGTASATGYRPYQKWSYPGRCERLGYELLRNRRELGSPAGRESQIGHVPRRVGLDG